METAETAVKSTDKAGAVSMSPPPPCSACGKPATTKAGLCGECDRRAGETRVEWIPQFKFRDKDQWHAVTGFREYRHDAENDILTISPLGYETRIVKRTITDEVQ